MKSIHISTGKHLHRRTFLKGMGATMALPFLDAMRPAFAKEAAGEVPRRMIAINVDLGFMPEYFFPKATGKNFELTPYLQPFGDLRDQLTVFSGVSHPHVDGGHAAAVSFLTGAPHPTSAGFKNSISLDQYAAQHIGHKTRYPTLNLRVGAGDGSLSYTDDGVRIPSEVVPSNVYRQLFVQGSESEIDAQMRKLREGKSLMDSFSGRIKQLQRDVGDGDRERLDQYFTSVREVEQRLVINQEWLKQPKPKVSSPMPVDNLEPGALVTRTRNMYDLAKLALETDSTRLVTILVTQDFSPKVDLPGVTHPHHSLTHQSGKEDSRKQLAIIETAQMAELARLSSRLAEVTEGGETLLDRTMVMQGSNLGHANRHDVRNLPVVLLGGGFKHGNHLAFDRERNAPLANLYVSMLQRLGLDCGSFSTGSSSMTGLEIV